MNDGGSNFWEAQNWRGSWSKVWYYVRIECDHFPVNRWLWWGLNGRPPRAVSCTDGEVCYYIIECNHFPVHCNEWLED